MVIRQLLEHVANLKTPIKRIPNNRVSGKLNFSNRTLFALFALTAIGNPFLAGSTQKTTEFEAASIKLVEAHVNDPKDLVQPIENSPETLTMRNQTPVPGKFVIMRQSAFDITHDNVPASDEVSTPLVWTPGS